MTTHRTGDLDPFFTVDDRPVGEDDPDGPDRRPSTYWDVERGCRGPGPLPGWVVTDRGAVDVELGVLKTGKEADVFLVRREATDGTGPAAEMAAKRYRDHRRRTFHRSAAYTETRRARRSRDTRAVARRSAYGRGVEAGMWVRAEWEALTRCWGAGVPVPYPVQLDGNEILMELVGRDGRAAPRLAQVRPEPDLLDHYLEQMKDAMLLLASEGLAHGDLSPYNVLADGERLVLIDLPQVVDVVANPQGLDFLRRDCRHVCAWFGSRGLPVDADVLCEELVRVLS